MRERDLPADDQTIELRRNYGNALHRRVIELHKFSERCLEGRVMPAEFDEIHMRVRSLVGSGGMYGYPELAKTALFLDRALERPTSSGLKKLAELADNLAAFCERSLSDAAPASLPASFKMSPQDSDDFRPVLLTVDDDPAIHDMMQMMFRDNAHLVTAYNGVEALEAVHRHCPDIILLDSYMPEMNGFNLLERMNHEKNLSTVPVIMLTASGQPQDVMRATTAGITDYVTKPFDPQQLCDKISTLMKRMRTTILIANGNTVMRELMTSRLRRMGFNVTEAGDGQKTLELALAKMPELIVLDQSLPDIDGHSPLHRLRENKRTRHIPMLYLSTNNLGQNVIEGLNTGTIDQAVTPLIPEKVTSRILAVLESEAS